MKKHIPVLQKNARIGIINRGEAALRFIRAVREYNSLHGTSLQTISFYIEAEEKAPFVKMADEVILLSDLKNYPGKQKSPYLDHELMIDALEHMHCDAIWVGWGFVSEDAVFAKKIEKLGIVFMGPSSKAMSLLGDKIVAKELAEEADVPILPWSKRAVIDLKDAEKISKQIGYPVIVKAANAGGGRGIRFVRTPEELSFQFKSAREETIRVTGNDVVFIEALVEKGRHLEVQVLADSHGTVNTFGVRDCSVQRKNQKIIEETPPAGLSKKLLDNMEAAARRLIQKAHYTGAGTVEFLYDLNRKEYYFMEVNTRLQVEHPVTETLYGVDLVKGQIDVARGLEVDLSDRTPRGAVVEVRLNAEDPERDFSPAPGEVILFDLQAGPGIRVDSGIEQGSTIPGDFDSMVAKIIAHAPTRAEALARLEQALLSMRISIRNGTTNRAFLLELLKDPNIKKGGVHTGFVEELLKLRKSEQVEDKTILALLAGSIESYISQFQTDYLNFKEQIRRIGRPRTLPGSEGYEVNLSTGGNNYKFHVQAMGNDIFHIHTDNSMVVCRYRKDHHDALLIVDEKRHNILMTQRGDQWQCEVDGYPIMLESDSEGYVKSPSPAIVLSVNTKVGKKVKKGDVLVVLEAMKMEMLVQSPGEGVVNDICVSSGTQVAAGQALFLLDLKVAEKEESTKTAPSVRFNPPTRTEHETWEIYVRKLNALFLGYDYGSGEDISFSSLMEFSKKHPQYKEKLISTILKILNSYVALEQLFMTKELMTNSFARPISYQELLTHYFLRENDPEKGLPDVFLNDLVIAARHYYKKDVEQKIRNKALYHIFRSHGRSKAKRDMLKQILFSLEDLSIPKEYHPSISAILGRIVQLTQTEDASTADAALYARYRTIDRITVEGVKEKQAKAIDVLLKKMTKTDDSDVQKEKHMNILIDSTEDIVARLTELALNKSKIRRELGLEILARRLNRDRTFISGRIIHNDGLQGYVCESRQSGTDEKHMTLTTVINEKDLKDDLIVELAKLTEIQGDLEITCFVRSDHPADVEYLDKEPWTADKRVKTFTIAWFTGDQPGFYRTWYNNENGWKEYRLARGFSPIEFRELRVKRLENFDNKILYRSSTVTLLESSAKSNPKEKRLFALAGFSDPKPVLNKDKSIDRMIMFENAFMEAVFAMRAVQAKYRFRLQWNRIIMHNRSVLDLSLGQLKHYGQTILPHTHDLGLEKMVVYTRREQKTENRIEELELIISNTSQEKFTIGSRKPETIALEPYDDYTSKVVRARQRKTVYPYEFIKMITYAGFPLFKGFPKGEFEEYDIKINSNGKQRTVSVKGREYGQNNSNVVFGIIRHPHPSNKTVMERVIILSDPTKDLGSLAEPECRRVISALDIAEKKKIPVEWLPISSGAKIDMKTGTENLDWTASVLNRIIAFTQKGGEINVIVSGVNVGAQSYWNAEATMLMHTRGLLIMTEDASMLLTGKRALDFSGSVSGETNLDIGGAEKIMDPNGQSQIRAKTLADAYQLLLNHYSFTCKPAKESWPPVINSSDPSDRDITHEPYNDFLNQGFKTIGDIFSQEKNPERKKPFDTRQIMQAVKDNDAAYFERWQRMKDADTAIIWETRLGGHAVGMIGIESRPLPRFGAIPHDGPETWSGGTLFPGSSKKIARAINAFSGSLPLVILANLSGFDGSPESLRKLQLEYGAEIGRAIVNYKGPIVFLVIARYHGGAYVVFSKSLNPNLRVGAVKGSYASVLGGAPAAAVIFPREVSKETYLDPRLTKCMNNLNAGKCTQHDYDELFRKIYNEKQRELGQLFDKTHSVERAKRVGSIDDIVTPEKIRSYLIRSIEKGMKKT